MSDGNNCVGLNACDVSSIRAATCELTMDAFTAVPTSKQYRGSISCKFHYWPSSASGHTNTSKPLFQILEVKHLKGKGRMVMRVVGEEGEGRESEAVGQIR